MNSVDIGLSIKEALRVRNRSQKWLALTIEVPHQNVSRWIRNEVDVRFSTITRISAALEMKESELIALGENP
jgi:plasmid maintenance system antidote protein VapI